MTNQFESLIEKATSERSIPGVLLLASDSTGSFTYKKTFGPATPTAQIDENSTFILASCTKLVTSIAALQCVEKGLITLDEDVGRVLPELKDPEVLTGFEEDGGKPILVKAKGFITLRQLLTHTAGLAYADLHPALKIWQKYNSLPTSTFPPLLETISLPLIFEPGTSWIYGPSTDWTGVLISRLTNQSLSTYFQDHIFTPLKIKNLTFHQEQNENVKENLVKLSKRKGAKGVYSMPMRTEEAVEWTDDLIYETPTTNEFGGSGLVGSPVNYLKILRDLISPSPTLLSPSTINEMFKPQLSGTAKAGYQAFADMDWFQDTFASVKKGTDVNWGLGRMMVCENVDGGRKKGTLSWSGLPNLLWTVDREVGLVVFYASNVVPFGDFRSGEWQRAFEKEVYERFERERGKEGAKL